MQSPFFHPSKTNLVGITYEIDVTGDVEAWRTGLSSNQGWATWHDDMANIQNVIASANNPIINYRPKLVVIYTIGYTVCTGMMMIMK